MLLYVCRRILQSVPTLLGIVILTFLLVRWAPGDPVMLLLGERGGSPEAYARMQALLGLDQPLWKQLFLYVKNMLTGDFGHSIVSKEPVLDEFLARFPATIELGLSGLLLAIGFGVPLGVWAAVKKHSLVDTLVSSLSLTGYSMPVFWWGLLLILFFSVGLGWTPVSGRVDVIYDIDSITGFLLVDSLLSDEPWPAFLSSVHHLLLPALTLGTIPLAVVVRMTRSSMLEVLHQDYIRTAKAKGLQRSRVIFVHALNNALIPIITVVGLMLGALLTGAVLTETIFSWPGIGRWLVNSVQARDYPVIQGGVFCIGLVIVSVNILVDVLYTYCNPKLRDALRGGN